MARGRFAGRYGAAPPDGPLAVAKTRLRLERLAARPAVAVYCSAAAQCGMMAVGAHNGAAAASVERT